MKTNKANTNKATYDDFRVGAWLWDKRKAAWFRVEEAEIDPFNEIPLYWIVRYAGEKKTSKIRIGDIALRIYKRPTIPENTDKIDKEKMVFLNFAEKKRLKDRKEWLDWLAQNK